MSEAPRTFMIEWTDEGTAVDRFANAKTGFTFFHGDNEEHAKERFNTYLSQFKFPPKLRIDKVTEVFTKKPEKK